MAAEQWTLYFSSKFASAVKTRTSGKSTYIIKTAAAPLPEGTVVNGVIMEEDVLLKAVAGLKNTHGIKNAVLVADTSRVMFRLSAMPKTSPKEMEILVKNEFIGRAPGKDYIYDYSFVPSRNIISKQRLVLSCAIDKETVDTYKSFFKQAGITLDRVDFSTNAVLQAMASRADLLSKTNTMVCVIDHYILSMIHIAAGGEVYFHRSRIISMDGEAYYKEISGNIYSRIQGGKTVNREETGLEDIYIFDANVRNHNEYTKMAALLGFARTHTSLTETLNLQGDTEHSDQCVYCICSAASAPEKNIDLSKKTNAADINKELHSRGPLAAVILCAIMILASVFVYITTNNEISVIRSDIAFQYSFINNPDTRTALSDYGYTVAEQNDLANRIESYKEYIPEVGGLSSGTVVKALEILQNTTLRQFVYDGEENIVSFSMTASDPALISPDIEKLRKSGLFADIKYGGYSGDGRSYAFTLDCTLPEAGYGE